MTYYETPGVLSDVCQFMNMFYNERNCFDRMSKRFNGQVEYLFEFYLQLKPQIGPLPSHLLPFSYFEEKIGSFFLDVVYRQPMESVTLESLIEYISSDDFILQFYRCWFGATNQLNGMEDVEKLDKLQAVAQLQVKEDFKYQLLGVLQTFNQCRADLIEMVVRLYSHMVRFRQTHQHLLDTSRDFFNSAINIDRFHSEYNIDITDFKYSIALVNCIHIYLSPNRKLITLGVRCNVMINKKPDLKSFAFVYQDPEKVKILDFISSYGPVRKKDIDEYMQIWSNTVQIHLNDFGAEGITKMTYQNNVPLYSINQNYYQKLPKVFDQTIGRKVESLQDEMDNSEGEP